MVKIAIGDILASKADCIAIPVNLKGVMGAGLAKAFALAHPECVGEYRGAITRGRLAIGKPCIVGGRFMMVATKDHFRNPSRMEYVTASLESIARDFPLLESIALPALGCGCGGLRWEDVRAEVERVLGNSPIEVELYAPRPC